MPLLIDTDVVLFHTQQSDPYAFLAVSSSEELDLNYDTWSIQTYRSRCAPGGTNPVWNHPGEDEFSFRFAIPTHQSHYTPPIDPSSPVCRDRHCAETAKKNGVANISTTRAPTEENDSTTVTSAERIWDSATAPASRESSSLNESVEVLESLFQHSFTGPPLFLHCAVFHKTKLFAHHFMGRGKVRKRFSSSR
jgi:hypothetical protein